MKSANLAAVILGTAALVGCGGGASEDSSGTEATPASDVSDATPAADADADEAAAAADTDDASEEADTSASDQEAAAPASDKDDTSDAPKAADKNDASTAAKASDKPAPAVADNGVGKAAFAQCKICHTLKKGEPNLIGPNLYGIMGTKAGAKAGYAFSKPLIDSGIVWNTKTLDDWIKAPRKMIPATKMAYAGMADAEKRKALVDYIARETK